MKTEFPDLPLALVIWRDANTDGTDVLQKDTVSAYHKHTLVHTLGWIMKEDDVGITLVTEFYDEFYRGRTFIPRENVAEVVRYKLAKTREKKPAAKLTVNLGSGIGFSKEA
jgi:hypothetical protein